MAHVDGEWRALLTEALAGPHGRYGLDIPLEALVSLVMTFNSGVILERLAGITTGHEELLAWIDGWIEGKERE